MASAYSAELRVALQAVQLASRATKKMQTVSDKGTQDKLDDSPVTVADFAAQALLISAVHHAFPHDGFIAEESSDMLRSNPALLDRVFELVVSMAGKENVHGLQIPSTKDEVLDIIDRGSGKGENDAGRIWILDPVDGTATFMTGNQYAVCLALVEGGKQKVGVLGCPNLFFDESARKVEEELVDRELDGGLVLSAVVGEGSYVARLADAVGGQRKRVLRDGTLFGSDQSKLMFTDSLKSPNITTAIHEKVFQHFTVPGSPLDLWSMQMKYIALALGAADAMLRVPPNKDYRACVWDHAGGQLIFEEAGGKVRDLNGNEFDFGLGRRLAHNYGLVATAESVHSNVFRVVQKTLLG